MAHLETLCLQGSEALELSELIDVSPGNGLKQLPLIQQCGSLLALNAVCMVVHGCSVA